MGKKKSAKKCEKVQKNARNGKKMGSVLIWGEIKKDYYNSTRI